MPIPMRNPCSQQPQQPYQLQQLKQSILDTEQSPTQKIKERYSFHKRLEQKLKNKQTLESESNKQIDVLDATEYLKLLCHQKKYLSNKRADKITQLNESLRIEQEDFKFLFMIATQAHYFKLHNPGYYQKILEQIPKYPKNMFSAIEKDIHRTLMNDHPFQTCLRNVLVAFAIRNPNLMYCQGMNYIVAFFLINSLSQEETFWILVCLVENILPEDYFKDLTTISITTQIFSDVLPYLFPDMGREMKTIGMDCSLFIVSWYVCLFTKGFINSVSSYLFTKLILQSRNHSFGFTLLKLSLGVIAAILGRDEPFTFKPEFSAFRDKFETSVFEISLLQIKLGVEYVELNEQNYLKLQKYYRDKREQHQIGTLQRDLKNKKFLLPVCSPEYPVCLHRIQIQRKIGNVEQVIIMKNGFDIMSQYVSNYFDLDLKKQLTCNLYQSIDDCLLYRQKHICELDLQNRPQINLKTTLTNNLPLRHEESFQLQVQRQMLSQQQNSIEVRSSFSKVDEKFRELSGYFVVDEKFKFSCEEGLDDEDTDIQFQDPQRFQNPVSKTMSNIDRSFDIQAEVKALNDTNRISFLSQKCFQNRKNIESSQNKQQGCLSRSNQDKQIKISVEQQNEIIKEEDQPNNQSVQKNLTGQKFFLNKLNIWSFLGQTWRKVVKIKEIQLKN